MYEDDEEELELLRQYEEEDPLADDSRKYSRFVIIFTTIKKKFK
jgi:hypothetical protein